MCQIVGLLMYIYGQHETLIKCLIFSYFFKDIEKVTFLDKRIFMRKITIKSIEINHYGNQSK